MTTSSPTPLSSPPPPPSPQPPSPHPRRPPLLCLPRQGRRRPAAGRCQVPEGGPPRLLRRGRGRARGVGREGGEGGPRRARLGRGRRPGARRGSRLLALSPSFLPSFLFSPSIFFPSGSLPSLPAVFLWHLPPTSFFLLSSFFRPRSSSSGPCGPPPGPSPSCRRAPLSSHPPPHSLPFQNFPLPLFLTLSIQIHPLPHPIPIPLTPIQPGVTDTLILLGGAAGSSPAAAAAAAEVVAIAKARLPGVRVMRAAGGGLQVGWSLSFRFFFSFLFRAGWIASQSYFSLSLGFRLAAIRRGTPRPARSPPSFPCSSFSPLPRLRSATSRHFSRRPRLRPLTRRRPPRPPPPRSRQPSRPPTHSTLPPAGKKADSRKSGRQRSPRLPCLSLFLVSRHETHFVSLRLAFRLAFPPDSGFFCRNRRSQVPGGVGHRLRSRGPFRAQGGASQPWGARIRPLSLTSQIWAERTKASSRTASRAAQLQPAGRSTPPLPRLTLARSLPISPIPSSASSPPSSSPPVPPSRPTPTSPAAPSTRRPSSPPLGSAPSWASSAAAAPPPPRAPPRPTPSPAALAALFRRSRRPSRPGRWRAPAGRPGCGRRSRCRC